MTFSWLIERFVVSTQVSHCRYIHRFEPQTTVEIRTASRLNQDVHYVAQDKQANQEATAAKSTTDGLWNRATPAKGGGPSVNTGGAGAEYNGLLTNSTSVGIVATVGVATSGGVITISTGVITTSGVATIAGAPVPIITRRHAWEDAHSINKG